VSQGKATSRIRFIESFPAATTTTTTTTMTMMIDTADKQREYLAFPGGFG